MPDKDFQVWVGQALDVSDAAVRSKFVKIDPQTGESMVVPLSVAAQAFGTPTYVYDGPPTNFIKNTKGTAGPITRVGDFEKCTYPKRAPG